MLALASADVAAAEQAADSEYWQRKRAAAREQLQQLRLEHEAHVREQREKEEAEKLLNRVSEGVRAGADAKQRKEIKRALSAREKERELARKQLEREQAMRDEESAAARTVAAARDRERVQFRDAEFQQKRARAAAAALEEEEEHRRRSAALQALADRVAPSVDADPRRVLQATAAVTAHVETERERGALFPVHGYNMGALLADTRFKLSLALNDAGLYGTEAGRRAMCSVQGSLLPRRDMFTTSESRGLVGMGFG